MTSYLVLLAWIAIWSGYNTTYFTTNSNAFNKWRSLIPFTVIIPSLFVILPNANSLLIITPLTLIAYYTLVGIIASFFSPRQISVSLWWGLMFSSTVLFLEAITSLHNPSDYLLLIINLNWVIASSLSLGLMGFFLIQPGVLKNLSFNSFFASSIRPFEGWLDIPVAKSIFGLIGTRPTGLARYSGISSLVMLCFFVTYYSWWWFFLFFVFTFILLFSKGKMEIGAFIVSMGFILMASDNLLSPLMIVYLLIVGISYVIVLGNVPYHVPVSSNQQQFQEQGTVKRLNDKKSISYEKEVFVKRIWTLSGRTTGVWPQAVFFIKKKPIIGYGFGIEQYLLKGWLDRPTTVDNTLLNALLQTGIIGTLLFSASLILTILTAYGILLSGNHSLVILESVSVGIFILLRGITQSSSSYSADWMFLVPIIAYMCSRS